MACQLSRKEDPLNMVFALIGVDVADLNVNGSVRGSVGGDVEEGVSGLEDGLEEESVRGDVGEDVEDDVEIIVFGDVHFIK